jgi:hypothetical protein
VDPAAFFMFNWLQEEQDEHGQGKWESGKVLLLSL